MAGGMGDEDEELAASLRQFGASDHIIQQWIDREENILPVYPRNGEDPATEEVIEAFMAVSTQWRTGGMGEIIGLDYTAADVALRRLGIDAPPEIWRGLKVMEQAFVAALRKKHGRQ